MTQSLQGSRLIARLDAEIRKTHHPVEAACLRAYRAAQQARIGEQAAAQDEVDSIHAAFDRQPNVAVSAWLCFAEACIAYFGNLSGSARDKMQRALALGNAAQLPRIRALSAAWLAQLDYLHHDFEAMVDHLRLAIDLAGAAQPSALGRACLVVAGAYHHANRLDLAQPWYARARECASREGDEATLSALIHNMAWHRANQAVQAAVFGGDGSADARHALAGADSTDNIGRWIGITSLDALVPMLRASVLSVLGEPAAALALYEAHAQDARRQGLSRMSARFQADMAWCRWRGGDAAAALREAASAAQAIDPSMDCDDQAIAHGLLAQVHRAAGDQARALLHEGKAREARSDYLRVQAQIVALLADLPLPPGR
jgi:hypothetical protein